jgi:RNA polymerase sigma-70 factor (ECF subfamily)
MQRTNTESRRTRHCEAAAAYRAALDLADNEAEREFLAARLVQAVNSGSDRSPES